MTGLSAISGSMSDSSLCRNGRYQTPLVASQLSSRPRLGRHRSGKLPPKWSISLCIRSWISCARRHWLLILRCPRDGDVESITYDSYGLYLASELVVGSIGIRMPRSAISCVIPAWPLASTMILRRLSTAIHDATGHCRRQPRLGSV